jgi:hypothetical protein
MSYKKTTCDVTMTGSSNKMELEETHSLHFSKTLITASQLIQYYIPEDLNFQHYFEKFNSHIALSTPY